MQTTNGNIKSLVSNIVLSAQDIFGDRLRSIYIMGSLARGGFSEVASDIDIGLIIHDPLNGAAAEIDRILVGPLKKHSMVRNKVSIFWGSIKTINGASNEGRYPPFDRLDLIDNARLIAGEEIRNQLIRPTKKELEIASAKFSLEYLSGLGKCEEFFNCQLIADKGTVYVTKTVLFPARFIYLAKTGKIAGNDESYKYYIDNFKGSDAELVKQGYSWRQNSLPVDLGKVVELLNRGLVTLYCNFIDIYIEKMQVYGEEFVENELTQWKKAIARLCF